MGYSVAWVAVGGKSPDTVLGLLGLNRTGEYAEDPSPPDTWGAELPGGLYLVFGNRPILLHFLPLGHLSDDAELVACSVMEQVGRSHAEGWSNGAQTWSVLHDPEQGSNHLEVHGDLPPEFASIHARLTAAQAAEDQGGEGGIDYLFGVPVELAQALVGSCQGDYILVRNDEHTVPPELSAALGGHQITLVDEKIDAPPELATFLAGRPIIVGEGRFEKLRATSPQVAPPERSGNRWPMVERLAYWLLRVLRGG